MIIVNIPNHISKESFDKCLNDCDNNLRNFQKTAASKFIIISGEETQIISRAFTIWEQLCSFFRFKPSYCRSENIKLTLIDFLRENSAYWDKDNIQKITELFYAVIKSKFNHYVRDEQKLFDEIFQSKVDLGIITEDQIFEMNIKILRFSIEALGKLSR